MALARESAMTFSELKQGMSVRIVGINSNSPETRRLQEMGLTVGTIVRVVKVAPFGDPVEIDLRGYRLCLRKKETIDFDVEQVA